MDKKQNLIIACRDCQVMFKGYTEAGRNTGDIDIFTTMKSIGKEVYDILKENEGQVEFNRKLYKMVVKPTFMGQQVKIELLSYK